MTYSCLPRPTRSLTVDGRHWSNLTLLVGLCLLLPIPLLGAVDASSDRPGSSAPKVETPVKPSDRAFLESVNAAHTRGAAISRVATDRSTHAQVRSLSQMLGSYHDQTLAVLNRFARARSVDLPVPTNQEPKEDWMGNDAVAFDDAYLDAVEENHETIINLCEEAVQSTDPDIARFAQEALPALHDHLTQIRNMRALRK